MEEVINVENEEKLEAQVNMDVEKEGNKNFKGENLRKSRKWCGVPGCVTKTGVPMFYFPGNKERREQWRLACGLKRATKSTNNCSTSLFFQ